MKDLLYDCFICDGCGKLTDNDRKIIRKYDVVNQAYFVKDKELCFNCAIGKKDGEKHEI